MMFCQRHMCRSGPAEVAHYDFLLNEASGGTPLESLTFSGRMEMCVETGKIIMFAPLLLKGVSPCVYLILVF